VAEAVITLHARIGRISPRSPHVGAAANDAQANRRDRLRDRLAHVPCVVVLLLALALALWPHWTWMAHRLTDGSDEPWGVLALVTVLVLVGREWRKLVVPPRAALLASAALVLLATGLRPWVPALAAAAIAMGALAVFLAGARRDRPATPLATLLLLALPVIASLQFYFGYPLRLVTAALAAPVLQLLGFSVQAAGAAFAYEGRIVLVDPPCAGIGMLWVGAYTAALLSYLNRATAGRTLLNGAVAAGCVLAANVVRNVALFFPEGLELGWPAWTHAAIGLLAFAIALLPVVLFVQRSAHRKPERPLARIEWPQRYHRRVV
jgi:exosortase/archaeosortase family protein